MDAEHEPPPMVELIESRLERLDLTPEEAFRQAGLPPDLLPRLRDGTAQVPRGARLVRLAEVLGTSVSWLVGLDPDVAPPTEVLEEEQGTLGLLAGDEEALLRAYRALDFPTKAALLTVVRKMSGPEPAPEPSAKGKRRAG
ncbi:hypothetical protein [Roseomonas xinghualingensis]|uniref:hypothetical protein n=1 Tax=Roseomonas xinghualingensis TaxID=2986475 RepID=UPI0021F0BD84|nr:hypothetical protein [Roseomonas sp. SXEYE001]MCV4208495.1 hypothetical protein [Roseomonas sp. SXEYE001]